MSNKRTLLTLQSNEIFSITAHRLNHTPYKGIAIYGDIYPITHAGKCYSAVPLVFTERNPYATSEPISIINNSQAQELIDSLWVCGIRPMEGEGSAGSMSAVQKHLSDMRKIVEKKLSVQF